MTDYIDGFNIAKAYYCNRDKLTGDSMKKLKSMAFDVRTTGSDLMSDVTLGEVHAAIEAVKKYKPVSWDIFVSTLIFKRMRYDKIHKEDIRDSLKFFLDVLGYVVKNDLFKDYSKDRDIADRVIKDIDTGKTGDLVCLKP